jgi:hypothetical protein
MRIKTIIFLIFCFCLSSQAAKIDNSNDLLKSIAISDTLFVRNIKNSLSDIDIDFEVMKNLNIKDLYKYINIWENTKFQLMMEKEYNSQIPYFRNI